MPSSSFNLWCRGYDTVRLNQANTMDVPVLVFIFFFFLNKHNRRYSMGKRRCDDMKSM